MSTAVQAAEPVADQHPPRILVVDDERSMRELLAIVLRREGYEVLLAENGRAAIGLLDVHGTAKVTATGSIAERLNDAAADVVAWDLPHEVALVQPWGTSRAARVWRDGVVIARDAD